MDFDQYVAARYGRLIEHAVLIGCAEGEAGTVVDQVLLAQRKAIRRSEDPDQLVMAALERAVDPPPQRRSRATSFAAVLVVAGLVGLVVVVAVALVYRPEPVPMPSLFGYDGDEASSLLERRGFEVTVRPVRACDPVDQVIASDPRPGDSVRPGAQVAVFTAIPSGPSCEPKFGARSDAWAFIAFAIGLGSAPPFSDLVNVVVDRSESATLTATDAGVRDRWGGTLRLIADAAQRPAQSRSALPTLVVDIGVPPAEWCGVPRPLQGGERSALRFQIDPRRIYDDGGCPLTVDLYRTGDVIDSVVVYTAKRLSTETADVARE